MTFVFWGFEVGFVVRVFAFIVIRLAADREEAGNFDSYHDVAQRTGVGIGG